MPRSTSDADHPAAEPLPGGLELPEHLGEDEPGRDAPPELWELEDTAPRHGGSPQHAPDPARSDR